MRIRYYFFRHSGIPKLSRCRRGQERICSMWRSFSQAPEWMRVDLWEYAWGSDKPVNMESLHVYIYRLRNKLNACQISIETMVNVGYRLLLANSTASR